MYLPGGVVTEKKAAGEGILGLCKSMTSPEPIQIGRYRGFDMELSFDSFSREFRITLKGNLSHTTSLGTDIFGNIQRLDNLLGSFSEKLGSQIVWLPRNTKMWNDVLLPKRVNPRTSWLRWRHPCQLSIHLHSCNPCVFR